MIQLLQAAPTPGMGGLLQFAPMIFIFVIFYFLLIAPMRKKQKKTQEMLAKLKKGDEVVTQGGVFGRIAALDDERGIAVLEISSNVKVKVLRSAVVGLAGESEEKAAS
jgi:preprotein translocase subunit YajC